MLGANLFRHRPSAGECQGASGRPDERGNDQLAVAPTASSIRSRTGPGCEASDEWLASSSMILRGAILERGSIRLQLNEGPSGCVLDAGDLVLVPHGDAHLLLSHDPASWVKGTFAVEDAVADPLLSVLPSTIVIRGNHAGNKLAPPQPRSPPGRGHGRTPRRPGAQVMVSRILLFIHALRAWAADGVASPGWLTAAMDSALGPVLSAVHRTPQHGWTVDEVARRANLSRSAFEGRFTRLLGISPAAYIAERRLDRAAHLLRSTTDLVGQIAAQVGYTSEAAFSRAFRRRFGVPPRRWGTTTPVGLRKTRLIDAIAKSDSGP